MECKYWIDLFGRSTEDQDLRKALTDAGVSEMPLVEEDDPETTVEFDELMLVFTDAQLFPNKAVGDGVCVLTGIVLPVVAGDERGRYNGKLPFKVTRTDTQDSLRGRLGEPTDEDEDLCWDEWDVEGLKLRAEYSDDFKTLKAVFVSLPDPE